MPKVILHDTRLLGRVEPGNGTVIEVDASVSLADGFRRVTAAADSSDTELVIACHGYMSHEYGNACNTELGGGFGLSLCREGLVLSNVSRASALAGYFSRVWLMACGPAGTAVHDSRPFCRELALHVDCDVIAAEREQTYTFSLSGGSEQTCRPVLRFGAWEGRVFTFHPDGTYTPFERSETPLP